ncbi:ABC-2 type transport system permease protein [Haloechinothrix alba]|uniref:ABC-2 type transport system permease protein n=1 Tax=Haloechinothrix alba TaxID=664784 RepID=A0A238YTR5_9PSEU|nr:ABC-2 type transport system permease protein [Haloechinothrix alba]
MTTVDTLAAGWQPTRAAAPFTRLVWSELRWIFRRPRTLVVLGVLGAIPVIIGLSVHLSGSTDGGPPNGEAPLFVTFASSALALPVGTLSVTLMFLLPLTVAMVGADAIAGEQSHGTLRGWLLAPVTRGRLLTVKALGVAVAALVAVTLMTSTGVVTGFVLGGTDGLFTLSGTSLTVVEALGRIGITISWVAVQLFAVGAVALAISTFTEHPMVVVAGILAGDILFGVLLMLSAVDWLHPFLLTVSWSALPDVLRDPIPTGTLTEGALRAGCYMLIGLSIAYARLTAKDG